MIRSFAAAHSRTFGSGVPSRPTSHARTRSKRVVRASRPEMIAPVKLMSFSRRNVASAQLGVERVPLRQESLAPLVLVALASIDHSPNLRRHALLLLQISVEFFPMAKVT